MSSPSDNKRAQSVEPEPIAGAAPVPMWLIAFLGLAIYVGDLYAFKNGGFNGEGFDSQVYYPYTTSAEVAGAQPVSEMPIGWKEGKAKFEALCAACHGADGGGNASTGYPPLAGSEWVTSPSPERVIRIVLNAVRGPIEVKGKTFDNQAMLAWRQDGGNPVPDADLANIFTYIRNAWGNKGSPVTVDQVAAIRKSTTNHMDPWVVGDLNSVNP
jgi:mono/diheme cytochrome c family protein